MEITTIVSACSLDSRFLPFVIRESRIFSKQLIISLWTHRLDGTQEPDEWIASVKAQYEPWCTVVVNTWQPDIPAKDGHNRQRIEGIKKATSPWILMLDADEVPEGERFREWSVQADRWCFCSAAFSCWWYFRSAAYRAQKCERCGLLFQRHKWTDTVLFRLLSGESERYGLVTQPGHLHYQHGMDRMPLFHHYSWVHGKEEMLNKVRSWAHKGDKPWTGLVEVEFDRKFDPEKDKDFVHGYTYRRVEPFACVGEF